MTKEMQDSMAEMPDTRSTSSGRNPRWIERSASSVTARRENGGTETSRLMEIVVARENMLKAYKQVMANKGAAGVDNMTVEELMPHLRKHWAGIKEELLSGQYRPQAVRVVEIPKATGGMRQLGIPTVVDRLIQQAVHQVLSPYFEESFSESSYGFRLGRSAHQAVIKAREHASAERRYVVDMDLEKFFDRVNHDVLMSRVARRVSDKLVMLLIRRYLQAGMMMDGVISQRTEGTPQGSPLSPLLSNILLDDLDKELERRGHKFCRYADDCNIYVRSLRAGKRVLESITRFLARSLRLRVNEEKSDVGRVWNRKFLGYTMTWNKPPKLKVAPESVKRLKAKVRAIMQRGRGRSIRQVIEELNPLLRGWGQYFRHAEVKNIFEELDGWIRRKLRCIKWQQWKRPPKRLTELMRLGLAKQRAWKSANNGHGAWYNAGASHMNEAMPKRLFDSMGLVSLLDELRRFQLSS